MKLHLAKLVTPLAGSVVIVGLAVLGARDHGIGYTLHWAVLIGINSFLLGTYWGNRNA